MKRQVIIANISYNPYGWRNPYKNPKASHSYAKDYPGHESLNFKFDKRGVDTNNKIYGYVQWTADPKEYEDRGTVIFYSKNTDNRTGEIVGIYGNVKILKNKKFAMWREFENNEVMFNLEADKELSILFPIPLKSDRYKESQAKRLVGQIGFSYYDEKFGFCRI